MELDTGYGGDGWGNDEWQLYTNDLDNVKVGGWQSDDFRRLGFHQLSQWTRKAQWLGDFRTHKHQKQVLVQVWQGAGKDQDPHG
jgi:hypothetical protein